MRKLGWLLFSGALLAGCPSPMNPDAGDARPDTARPDARDGGGTDVVDAMQPMDARDATMEAAAEAGPDAPADMGTDAGTDTGADAMMDASGPSGQIAAVRAATPGAVDLPVNDVLVTYVVAATLIADGGVSANDPAGFFVQADRTGPALFVAVDPATLTPRPMVGDRVSFRVTMTSTTRTGAVWATAISGFMRSGGGNPIAPLVQDLSAAADLVTGLPGYESEVVRVQGTVATDFAVAGTGFESAQITTMGVTTASTNLRLRIPATLRSTLGLRNGCQFTVNQTPLWRFFTQTQVSAWVAGDIMVGTCPPVMDAGPEAGVDAAADTGPDVVVVPDVGVDVPIGDGGLPQLVVNEVSTRGAAGAAGDEFVEIYNAGTTPVSLANWTLRYASAGATTTGNLQWTGEAGLVIPPGGYVVAVPATGFTGTIPATAIRSTAPLLSGFSDTGGQIGLLDPTGTRVDSVAYGAITSATPVFREGTMAAPIGASSMNPIATARIPNGADTNNNAADFQARNAITPGGPNS